jgi:hypothetical protein
MSAISRRNWLIVAAAIAIFCTAVAIFNVWLTNYIESERFRAALENETAKGLHFSGGRYAPIRRTGFLTATSDHFEAQDGRKAMQALDARDITAKFNPLGLFLRRWQFDDVHIQSGAVQIHIYKAVPEPSRSTPWFSAILPNRAYLKQIETETADVTWRLRGKQVGFFGTRLLITSHGRDFDYQAAGGTLKMTPIPDLYLRGAHLLITRKLLTLYDVDLATGLAPGPQSEGDIHAHGNAGIAEDKSVDLEIKFERLPIGPWLPASWKEKFSGDAFGRVRWTGKNRELESSSGDGALRVRGGRIDNLPLLHTLATIAQKKSLEHLRLDDCAFEVRWSYPKIDVDKIGIEALGKFRIEGKISINDHSLGGAVRLGISREYLDWLPNPEEVFTREEGGYMWTTVHLSGTLDHPQQDLSLRIIEALKESPATFLAAILREITEWLKSAFGD